MLPGSKRRPPVDEDGRSARTGAGNEIQRPARIHDTAAGGDRAADSEHSRVHRGRAGVRVDVAQCRGADADLDDRSSATAPNPAIGDYTGDGSVRPHTAEAKAFSADLIIPRTFDRAN